MCKCSKALTCKGVCAGTLQIPDQGRTAATTTILAETDPRVRVHELPVYDNVTFVHLVPDQNGIVYYVDFDQPKWLQRSGQAQVILYFLVKWCRWCKVHDHKHEMLWPDVSC